MLTFERKLFLFEIMMRSILFKWKHSHANKIKMFLPISILLFKVTNAEINVLTNAKIDSGLESIDVSQSEAISHILVH